MELEIKKLGHIAPVALRRLGYAPYINKEGQQSFVRRPYGTQFPRYHLYIKEEDDKTVRCSVHLDQKAPSYMGSHAHGGDYDSETVRQEIERLQNS